MSVVDALVLSLILTCPVLTDESVPSQAAARHSLEPLLSSSTELEQQRGAPHAPAGLAKADLDAEIARLNLLWADAQAREQALVEQVGGARLAALPDGDHGVAERPLTKGAIARRLIRSSDGAERAVDLMPGECEALDVVRSELALLHDLGDQLVDRWFDPAADIPGDDPPIPIPQPRCVCAVSSNSTAPGGNPPSCAASWGISYSVAPGICNIGSCPGPMPCSGTMTVSMSENEGKPCSWEMKVDSPPGELVWHSTGITSWSVDVNLSCGNSVTLHWSANGVDLGSTTLTCENCPAHEQ